MDVNRNSQLSLSSYQKHSRQKTHFPWGTSNGSVLRIVLCVSGGNVIVRENSCRVLILLLGDQDILCK